MDLLPPSSSTRFMLSMASSIGIDPGGTGIARALLEVRNAGKALSLLVLRFGEGSGGGRWSC